MLNFFKTVPSVTPQETIQKIINDSVDFIDVRSAEEYNEGHATGARNIPLETLVDKCDTLKNFSKVYVICRSGGRSAQATSYLLSKGINALNVSGGTIAWQSAGLPME